MRITAECEACDHGKQIYTHTILKPRELDTLSIMNSKKYFNSLYEYRLPDSG